MKAIKFVYGADVAVKKAFESGSDIVIFRFNKDEEERVIEQVIKLVEKGKIKESRINRSINRIIKVKEKYNISDSQEIEGIEIEKINKEIAEIRDKCNIIK